MHEIKFRGRDGQGYWQYGDYLNWEIGIPQIRVCRGPYYETFGVDRETVGQFTGLRDADGHEIYEGDIVRFNDEHGLVVWRAGEFDIDLQSGPCCIGALACLDMPFDEDDFNKIHVIGNVHDNPELLDGKDARNQV